MKKLFTAVFTIFIFSLNAQSPGGVSGNLRFWVKANAEAYSDAGTTLATDGQEVQEFHDQSGNSYDATDNGATGPDWDEDGVNFNPSLDFEDANSENLEISSGIFGTDAINDLFIYAVFADDEDRNDKVFHEAMASSGAVGAHCAWGDEDVIWDMGSNQTTGQGRLRTNWGTDYGITHLWAFGSSTVTGTPNGTKKYILRDNTVVDSGDPSTGNSTTGDNQIFFLGSAVNSNYLNGRIAEFIVYDGIPTETQEDQIQTYLAVKYGITLAGEDYTHSDGSTVIWDYSENTAYHYDIAGIGADATSGLDQRISKSINSDAIVTMCTEAIGTTNSGISTALTDDAYLLWGNNNAVASANADLPAGYTGRLPKEWKVEMTGTVADVHVQFDLPIGQQLAGDAAGDYYLLIDADGDFTSGATATVASSFSTGKVTFNDIDFTDGQYFTLATTQTAPGAVATHLEAWYKADAETYEDASPGTDAAEDTDDVLQWHDQSGLSHDATVATGSYPEYDEDAMNFNPALDFENGSSEYLSVSGGLMGTDVRYKWTAYTVTNHESTANSPIFSEDLTGTEDLMFLAPWSTNDYHWRVGSSGNQVWNGTGFSEVGTGVNVLWSMGAGEDDNTPGGEEMYSRLNGKLKDTRNAYETSVTGNSQNFLIGRWNGNASEFDGKIAELILYDGIPSALDEIKIQTYLAIKYGLTLTDDNNDDSSPGDAIGSITEGDYVAGDGTTVLWDYSANSAYHYDIAGLGRDDDMGLHQKQSKSSNSDAIVTMSTEAIGTTNAGIATTLTNDAYLLWGNNNSTTPAGDDLPAGYYGRLDKEWKVEMTGTVSNVHVEFDISSDILHLAGDAAGDFFILTDADGDFTSGATATVASSFSSNKVTFNDINFTDGHFFTLATQQGGPGGVSSHLQVWLKADAEAYSDAGSTLNTNATEVQEWHDQSGGTYDFTDNAGVGPDWDEDALNFNPGVDFVSGSSENLELSGGLMGTSATYDRFFYCVSRHDIDQSSTFFYEDCASNEYDAYIAWGGTNNVIYDVGNSSDGQGRIAASFTDFGNFYLWGLTSDETAVNTPSGSKKQILRDNVSLDAGNPTVNNSLTGNGSTMFLGSRNNSEYWDGTICEAIWFSDALSETDEDKVQTYLAVKYGITLSAENYTASDGTVIWDNSANSAYHYDIAGLGRDNVSGLHQKIGKSVESDAIVTMCTEAIGSTNAGISTTLTNDAYLLWGNNNATTSAQADLPSGYTGRLQKEWVVEMTGTVSNVHVEFNIADLGLAGDAAGDFYLLTDADGDFTASATATVATSLSSEKVTFDDVNFTDGQFFTLATTQNAPGGIGESLQYWLKYDAGTSSTTDETELTGWTEQSFNATTQTGAGGTAPTYESDGINFHNTVNFNGSNEYMVVDDVADLSTTDDPITWFVAATPASVTGQAFAFAHGTNTDGQCFNIGQEGASARWSENNDGNSGGYNSSPIVINTPYIYSGRYAGGTGGTVKGAIDGEQQYSTTGTFNIGTTTGYVGRVMSGVDYFEGDIHEIILYDTELSDLQALQVQSYLAIKYGYTLTVDNDGDANTSDEVISGSVAEGDYVAGDGSTIIWDHSAYSDYHYDIAGIGRDETTGSGLHQKQAKSHNSDAIVTISTEAIAADNATNGTSLTENAYLLWGNNNATTSAHDDLPAGYTGRLYKEWVVEMTGTVADVHVEFDISSEKLGGDAAADFYLLTDADGDFTSGATATVANSFSSNKVTFDDIDFTDGQYFTLATIQPGPGGVSNGLLLWLKADDQAHNTGTTLATDSQTVDNWHDQSTHDFDADDSGGTGPTWDADAINYNPALDFTGGATGTPLDIPAGIMEGGTKSEMYAYVVGQVDIIQTQALFYQDLNSGNATDIYNFIPCWSNSFTYYDHGHNSTGRRSGAWGGSVGVPYVWTLSGKASYTAFKRNGNSSNNTNTGGCTEDTNHPFYIGTQYLGANNYFDGLVAELIILDHAPTDQEEDQIESYLAMKYGITMDGTIAMFDADGTAVYADDATYDDGFVAIGRDDISEFDQRQSKSIESDAVLTLSTQAIAATNAANTTQLGTDNSYLFAAHNDGAADVSTSELHASFAERYTREWKVGEIGTVGNVVVEMDITGLTFAQETAGHFGLVIDDDGDFTGGTQSFVIADNLASDKVTFNTVDFTNGKYFTLMNSTTALPVELLNWDAKPDGCFGHLTWTTGSEINNDYFLIQYSYDAQTWTDLDKVYGAGNSTEVINYEYHDVNCFHNTTVYYRLIQYDFDGTETIFNIQQINLESPYAVQLYPNPTSNEFKVDLSADLSERQAIVIVRDIQGKELMRQTIGNGVSTVNVSNLPSNTYLIKVSVPNQLPYHTKLVKVD